MIAAVVVRTVIRGHQCRPVARCLQQTLWIKSCKCVFHSKCRRLYSNSPHHRTPLTNRQYLLVITNVCAFLIGGIYIFKRLVKKKSSEPETLNDPYLKKDAESFKYKDYWLPLTLLGGENTLKEIEKFKVRPSDIFVSSFPKSGKFASFIFVLLFSILLFSILGYQ